jgi:hypothetical protein
MATYIGNPDPEVLSLGRPVSDPLTLISMGQNDVTFRAGKVVFTKAVSAIVPGTTSLSLRNNADTADNLIITDAGNITTRGTFTNTYANGQTTVRGVTYLLMTLSTTTTVTTSTTNLLPVNSYIEAVACRVGTGLTTATSYKVGDPTSDARFVSFNTSIGAGQTQVGFNQVNPAIGTTLALSAVNVSATTVKITCDAVPGAGTIGVSVFYRQYTAPTS